MRAVVLGPLAVGLVGSVLMIAIANEFPTAQQLGPVLLVAIAVATTAFGILLPRLVARFDSLGREILVVSLAAMVTTGATITLSAGMLMVQPTQLGILVLVALVGAGFGVLVEYAVARDLAADALQLRRTAHDIARGELATRSDLGRRDEIGQAGRALDRMAARMAGLEDERAAARSARQAFLAAVGHDLRTPLTALRAALDALEDGLAPDPPRYFHAMRTDIDAIRRLVDDLFLLARIEGGSLDFERVTADLSELADDAVEALNPVAVQKGVSVRVEVDGGTMAPVGANEVSRVIRNLLDNAIRHAPAGSEVVIELSSRDGGVLVRVLDEGEGFSADLRADVLRGTDAIVRSAEGGGGAGLGLAIVRGLVDMHGGRIWLDEGKGGRVSFWVPATG